MINSDMIQTLVIDRPNLRMNNCEKIIGDLQCLFLSVVYIEGFLFRMSHI